MPRSTRHSGLVVVILMVLACTAPTQAAQTQRQREVERKGRAVMPFDLGKSLHVFRKTATGGIQEVVARDPHDAKTIDAIRKHLSAEADRFRNDDYADPGRIHGAAMPGIQYLGHAKPGVIRIVYRDIPVGGQIRFVSGDERAVQALHAWFDAQVSDHGHDAMSMPMR